MVGFGLDLIQINSFLPPPLISYNKKKCLLLNFCSHIKNQTASDLFFTFPFWEKLNLIPSESLRSQFLHSHTLRSLSLTKIAPHLQMVTFKQRGNFCNPVLCKNKIRAIWSQGNTQSPCVLLTETSPLATPNLSTLDALNFFSQNRMGATAAPRRVWVSPRSIIS